jgi:hypothetical protein
VRAQELGQTGLGEVGVRRGQKRGEILRIPEQVPHGVILHPGVLPGCGAGVIHEKDDVLPPEIEERLPGIRSVH